LTAGDTVTIGAQALTARAANAVENEFNIGADATEDATNLAAAINASAVLAPFFSASSALGVVTVTCRFTGALGNFIGLATSDATAYGLSAARFGSGGATVSGGTFVTGVRKVFNYGSSQT
jgi:phage tail sheath gpL-like